MTFLSIIIPVLNEAEQIAATLLPLLDSDVEIIVVDGGSCDQTVEIVQSLGVKVIVSPEKGRAHQMNYGAKVAQGEILFFLHGDTQIRWGYQKMIEEALSLPGVIAGAFELAIDDSAPFLRWVEKMVNLRSRLFSLPYGDQGLFLKTSVFQELGGFAPMPIMEDFELIQRLKKKGQIKIVPQSVLTSGRRWQKLGVWKTTLINQLIILGYYLGISPAQLVRLYRKREKTKL